MSPTVSLLGLDGLLELLVDGRGAVQQQTPTDATVPRRCGLMCLLCGRPRRWMERGRSP